MLNAKMYIVEFAAHKTNRRSYRKRQIPILYYYVSYKCVWLRCYAQAKWLMIMWNSNSLTVVFSVVLKLVTSWCRRICLLLLGATFLGCIIVLLIHN